MSSTEERRPWLAGLEALAIFAAIMLYIWWIRFRYPYSWIAILIVLVASHVARRETFARLGFRWDGTARSFADLSAPLTLVALVILAAGFLCRTMRNVSWDNGFSSLAVYFAWGLFQQYLLNGYFVNRLPSFLGDETRVPLLAATLFSLAHLPNWFLMLVTFAGGYVCARIYLSYRNLYFLGVAHGIVGFLIYLTVPDTVSHHMYVGPKWFSV